MPAVHQFALYSGVALLIDFFLQISCFIAVLSLDVAREEVSSFNYLYARLTLPMLILKYSCEKQAEICLCEILCNNLNFSCPTISLKKNIN